MYLQEMLTPERVAAVYLMLFLLVLGVFLLADRRHEP